MDRAPRSWSWVHYRIPYSSSFPSYYSHASPQGETQKEEWKPFFLALHKGGCFCIIGTFLPEGPCDADFCLKEQEHPGEALMRKRRGGEEHIKQGENFLLMLAFLSTPLDGKGDAGYVGYVSKEKSVLTD